MRACVRPALRPQAVCVLCAPLLVRLEHGSLAGHAVVRELRKDGLKTPHKLGDRAGLTERIDVVVYRATIPCGHSVYKYKK